MKCPSEVTLGFNPISAKHRVFKNEIGLILWSCISYQHIRNQYFNNIIMELVIAVYRFLPATYQDFKRIVLCSHASVFGREHTDNRPAWQFPESTLSDEFWMQVWKYIKYKIPTYKHQLSLFNDHLIALQITIKY